MRKCGRSALGAEKLELLGFFSGKAGSAGCVRDFSRRLSPPFDGK
jgi:hypothetical protein